jgi:FkbM family methyltransferase
MLSSAGGNRDRVLFISWKWRIDLKDALLTKLGSMSRFFKRVRGAVLLLRHVRKAFAIADREITIDDFDGDLVIDLRLNEHMQSQIFWYGYYSRDIVMALDGLLSPGMVVFDVGANIGEISLCAAKRVADGGRVYCFEPMPALYETLTYNLSRNELAHAHPIRMGVSNKLGMAQIYRSESNFKDGTVHDGLGTLYPMNNRTTPAGKIQLTSLDAFCQEKQIDRLDLIKIDVEGSELDVLMGGKQTLKRYRPRLIIEVQNQTAEAGGANAEDVLSYLEDLDYSFFTIGRKAKLNALSRDGIKRFQNVLCVPK